MTNEELGKGPVDETMRQRVHAIAQEAYRRRLEQTHPGHHIDAPTVVLAVEIALSGWTPPEPVDPDLVAFREWAAKRNPKYQREIMAGEWDHDGNTKAYLAGARMAREQEQERAKGLVRYVENDARRLSGVTGHVARVTLAEYRGEV